MESGCLQYFESHAFLTKTQQSQQKRRKVIQTCIVQIFLTFCCQAKSVDKFIHTFHGKVFNKTVKMSHDYLQALATFLYIYKNELKFKPQHSDILHLLENTFDRKCISDNRSPNFNSKAQ